MYPPALIPILKFEYELGFTGVTPLLFSGLNLGKLTDIELPFAYYDFKFFLFTTYFSAVFEGFYLYLDTAAGSIILGNILSIFRKNALLTLAISYLFIIYIELSICPSLT